MSMSGDPTLHAVRALEDEFAEAMGRMYTVGNDLARLRARLDHEAAQQAAAPAPATPPAPAASPAPTAAPAPAVSGAVTAPPLAPAPGAIPPPPTPPSHPGPRTPWWDREGLVARLFAVIGSAVTLIGVAFLLALAIQMGWFGPVPRVVSGALLATGLVTAAVLVRSRGAGTAGALGLAATGIATAYLDVLAVTLVYGWVPLAGGLGIAGIVALGGLLLARAWDSELLAVVAVLGVALLAPAVGFADMVLVGQFLVLLTIAAWPAQISRRWYLLEGCRVLPTAFVVTGLALVEQPLGSVPVLAVLLTGFLLVTSVLGVRVAAAPAHMGLLVPVASLPVVALALVSDRPVATALLTVLSLALIATAALGRTAGRSPLLLTPFALLTAGVTTHLAAQWAVSDADWAVTTTLGVAVMWALAALALRGPTVTGVALVAACPALLAAVSLLPRVTDRGMASSTTGSHVLSAALVVVLLLVLVQAVTTALPERLGLTPWLPRAMAAGALLAAGGGVVVTGSVVGGAVADSPGGGFTVGQTGATVLWLTTAAALLLRGLRGSSIAVPAGLTITGLALTKLMFFDLAFLDGVPRVLSFIVGGLIVLGTGAGYARALERAREAPVDNSTPDPAGRPTV